MHWGYPPDTLCDNSLGGTSKWLQFIATILGYLCLWRHWHWRSFR